MTKITCLGRRFLKKWDDIEVLTRKFAGIDTMDELRVRPLPVRVFRSHSTSVDSCHAGTRLHVSGMRSRGLSRHQHLFVLNSFFRV